MSRKVRIVLALAGLLLVCVSLCGLAYVFVPLNPVTDRATIAPTLFGPPQSSAAGWVGE
jgi:hypothetical protein